MQSNSEIIIYNDKNGDVKLDVRFDGESAWLSQKMIAELFGVDVRTVSEHIQNIFETKELQEISTIRKIRIVQNEGTREVSREVSFYNLDVIIATGYRVNSVLATQFRIWATTRLSEYIKKGFTMDDDRLKGIGGGNYWKELLDRIRDIRSSEKVLYRQVLDLYATSIDYDAKSDESVLFFKTVQNKLHYAANKHTAAETVHSRADAQKDFMGLTTFKGTQPVLSEVRIAKNYLNEDEIFILNRMVSAFFDLAEIKAKQETKMHMKDWVVELDKFAANYGKGILKDSGTVSHEEALVKAESEYRKYQVKTLSPVEEAYLESIKSIERKVEVKINKENKCYD